MAQNSFSLSECKIWEQFRGLFVAIDKGNNNVNPPINAYNGGLFAYDEILDKLVIKDEMFKHIKELARYDFESDLNVNILGHIFEQSLSDLEQIKNELDGSQEDKKNSKRKKDGIFYTPEYITHYIVEKTIGRYLEENPDKLEDIKILDPACGSGAFLNQAHSFLLKQRQSRVEEAINAEKSRKRGGMEYVQTDLFKHTNQAEHDRSILLNNLYGVDLNKESVEITKLALWLKTANSKCKLNNLDENIKCGNSLIGDETIAGDKAFKWEKQFSQILKQKELKAYHITFRTYGSYQYEDARKMSANKYEVPKLSIEEEEFIINSIADVIQDSDIRLLALNICKNHVHMAIVCEYNEIEKYIQKIKSVTSRQFNIHKGITIPNKEETLSKQKNEKTQNRLWASKYDVAEIKTEAELSNVISYIQYNRQKHGLSELNKDLQHRVMTLCWDIDKAFSPQYTGGFDCIIGNPPYVNISNIKEEQERKYLQNNYPDSAIKRFDLYTLFIDLSLSLLKKGGYLSFIIPYPFLSQDYAENLRQKILQKYSIVEIINLQQVKVFDDAEVKSIIIIIKNDNNVKSCSVANIASSDNFNYKLNYDEISCDNWLQTENCQFRLDLTNKTRTLINKLKNNNITFEDAFYISKGASLHSEKIGKKGSDYIFENLTDNLKPFLQGKDCIDKYIITKTKGLLYKKDEHYRPMFVELFENDEKLVIYKVTGEKGLIVCYDNNGHYANDSLYLAVPYKFLQNVRLPKNKINNDKIEYSKKINIKFALAIINSNLMNYYFKNVFGYGLNVYPDDIKRLPIPNATEEQQNSLSQKADRMIELNKSLREETKNALELIELEYKPKKISQKLEQFYTLGLNPFIEELDKLEVMTPSSKLSLSQKEDLISWYKSKSDIINKIKSEIDTIDHQIDQEVYKLYNLTPEEIQIMEES